MRKRKALIHHVKNLRDEFPLEFEDVDIYSAELYLDITNTGDAKEIISVIAQDKNRFKLIVRIIFQGKYDKYLYRKEDECVSAMKFKGSNQNSRIYCLEVAATNQEKRKVIMAKCFFNKTSEENNNTNKPLIKSIKSYEYEYKK